jgi:TRAP-type C4-dicarboxylate transport system substrate-binding protein
MCGVSACTDLPGSNDKAGGDPDPITLTMATDETAGRPAAEQIEEFARQVEERSGGSLVIEPRFAAAGGVGQTAWDQKVARLVVDGEFDLGMIPTRAWDTEGVDTLRALNTPFLITTDEAVNAVVTDDELATDLMSGLDEVGIAGLALVPEGLRHLFMYGDTTLTAPALAGAVVRAPRSDTTWAFLKAIGARPTDRSDEGSFTIAESSFAVAPGGVSRAAVGNLTLFPKVNVIAANSEQMAELTEEEQRIVSDAALATRDWAVAENVSDQVQADAWCANGQGDVTHASDALVSDIRAGARLVIEDLRADPQTADLITRIAEIPATANRGAVRVCRRSGATLNNAAVNVAPTGGGLPDGTYRAEYTDAYLRAHGLSEENVANNHGVWTFELKDGHWAFDQAAPDITDHDEGVYEVRSDDLYWALPEGQVLHFRWEADTEGDLHFYQYRDHGWNADPHYPFPDFQFDLEWVRVN